MQPHTFFRYQLRTTDIDAARTFYGDVVGERFWDSDIIVTSLPERAVALGAPPHWLGHINVDDLGRAVEQIVASGGERLGPTHSDANGSFAVLRDPFGAVMAVNAATHTSAADPVAWRLHHSRDHAQSFALYASMFGWRATDLVDLGPNGSYQLFAWDASGRSVGSMSNILSHRVGVHAQWLFFFVVDDIERAVATVQELGGRVLDLTRTSLGDAVAPCVDPQGGAFGLFQYIVSPSES